MIEFKDIPQDFAISCIRPYQREAIRIKYYIKQKLEAWKGPKNELYNDLSEELHLCYETIKKIAHKL